MLIDPQLAITFDPVSLQTNELNRLFFQLLLIELEREKADFSQIVP